MGFPDRTTRNDQTAEFVDESRVVRRRAMISRRTALGLIAASLAPSILRAQTGVTDALQPHVDAGKLPALADRLPGVPRVVNLAAMGRAPGRQGGSIRSLIGGQKDIRYMTVNGYSRLVGYDESLSFQPDILERFDVEEDRIFTFRLRAGHRWSDGAPLTTDDFRHGWDDVLMNKDLRPGGLPTEMMAGGEPPVFEVLDDLTVRFTFAAPNPEFLPALAAPQALSLLFPAHYLKQFHAAYADADALTALITKKKVEEWTDLYQKMSRSYRPENPDLPSLDPWINTTTPPAEQFVFVRNPYFHRVDENGTQLPYVNEVLLNIAQPGIIGAKTGAGESDLQFAALDFADYTYLKAAEKLHPVKVALWTRTQGSVVALKPNLNCSDQVWRGVLQDARVRRALSLAINRHEINMVSFFGLATESADTVLPQSPLYREEYANAFAAYDPDRANALLDEVGLTDRNDDGLRLLPDGRPMEIIVETAGESTLQTDVMELVTDHWRAIGIAVFVRATQRDIFRSRVMAGSVIMSVWTGLDNGVPTADMSPAGLAPTSDEQLEWPLWGMHYYSRGEGGTPPDMPEAVELFDLYRTWRTTRTTEERADVWHRMLALRAEQVFSIGLVNAALQPLVRSSKLRNMPDKGLYGFDPTSYLGVYMPDTFWYDTGEA